MDRKSPASELRGPRIILRHHDDELVATMFECIDRDRERLRRFMPWVDHVKSVADEEIFVQVMHKAWQEGTAFDYGIFDLITSEYMGNIGIHSISWEHERCELGYWLLGRFEGKGVIAEAVRLVESEMFGIGFNKIEIHCDTRNDRSGKIPARAGYHLDGILRKQRIQHGEFVDDFVFSKLRDEQTQD